MQNTTTDSKHSETDAEFLERAFQAVLGRDPDRFDSETLGAKLSSGENSREDILWSLIECPEMIQLRKNLEFVPPGHFYSAIPDRATRKEVLRKKPVDPLFDIDLRQRDQKKLLQAFSKLVKDYPFEAEPVEGLRYHFENPAYAITDGFMLYGMLRHFKPKRVVEIGSGYSSALMLDVRDLFLPELKLTFIEPYADLLKSLFKKGDEEGIEVHEKRVQDVDVEVFKELSPGDILFIDSTHVSKMGSDVNHLFFHILPLIAKGVLIHIHDIFPTFEYPKPWIKEGRAWNEIYLLRAFLMNNRDYRTVMFNPWIHKRYKEYIAEKFPLLPQNVGGSFWMRKRCHPAT